MEGFSRSRVQQLIAQGAVRVNGEAVTRRSRKVEAGDEVEVEVPPPQAPQGGPTPQDLSVPVLFEDECLIVVNKPARMAVHPGPGTPDGTVVNAVLHLCPDLPGVGGEVRPGIVHRLDKDTTGVLVVAKTQSALVELQRQFKARTVDKEYAAIVHGVPRVEHGIIERPLARHPKDRKRYTGRDTEGRKDAREARTRWRLSERYGGASLWKVLLDTGRTHQIRVHLSEAGFPLLGDELYGGTRRDRKSEVSAVREAAAALGHQALHARRLAFDHPASGKRMIHIAPEPPEWVRAVEILSRR